MSCYWLWVYLKISVSQVDLSKKDMVKKKKQKKTWTLPKNDTILSSVDYLLFEIIKFGDFILFFEQILFFLKVLSFTLLNLWLLIGPLSSGSCKFVIGDWVAQSFTHPLSSLVTCQLELKFELCLSIPFSILVGTASLHISLYMIRTFKKPRHNLFHIHLDCLIN